MTLSLLLGGGAFTTGCSNDDTTDKTTTNETKASETQKSESLADAAYNELTVVMEEYISTLNAIKTPADVNANVEGLKKFEQQMNALEKKYGDVENELEAKMASDSKAVDLEKRMNAAMERIEQDPALMEKMMEIEGL